MIQAYAWLVFLSLAILFPIFALLKPKTVPGLPWFLREFVEPWGVFGYVPILIIVGIFLGLTVLFWFWSRQTGVQ